MSVLIPTVGREELLKSCLLSLAAADPAPGEVLVVDQGGDGAAARAVRASGLVQARVLELGQRGISRALNHGLAHVRHDTVLVTHDDCRVARDWVGVAHAASVAWPGELLTGRVLPEGGEEGVPSTVTSTTPRVYRGAPRFDVLYPNNMVLGGHAARALGGFDERYTTAAEDNDFCYRWLQAGRTIRYEPALVVWHGDWRTPAELVALYGRYWRAQGELYAHHLGRGDVRVLPHLARNLRSGARYVLQRRYGRGRGRPRSAPDFRSGALGGLTGGLWQGAATVLREHRSD